MVVKESFNVAGLPTTWGIPTFKDWTPKEDAVAVTRLKSAGAVVLGKTNVPLVLGDWQSYNDIYGTTNNPWDGACGRFWVAIAWLGYRGLSASPGALLRSLRPQADAWSRASSRRRPAGYPGFPARERSCCRRTDGKERG